MPSIRPKNAGEWALLALSGTKGLQSRLAVSANDRADAYSDRDAERAERERERHQLEIERVKRRQAEEDKERLLNEQQQSAAREATRWGIDRMQKEIAAQQGGTGPQTDPETRALLERAGSIADKLSPAAQQTFLGEVQEMATTAKLSRAKDQAANRLANTIKDLSTSEVDVGPLIEQLTAAGEALQVAETPAQVVQAIQVIGKATEQAKQAIVGEHVKADRRAATIQSIQELYAGDPAKAGQASALARAVQFGVMEPDKALEMAVKDKYGLKPPSAQEIAAKGGPLEALYTTQQGRMAATWMFGEARSRVLKLMPFELGPEATTEQREAWIKMAMERETALVRSENGFFPTAQQTGGAGPQSPAKNRSWSPAESQFGDATNTEQPGAKRPPKVPLEQVRESMGSEPQAAAPKDDPVATAQAVAREIKARAAKEGWDRAKTEAEIKAALKDMGLID